MPFPRGLHHGAPQATTQHRPTVITTRKTSLSRGQTPGASSAWGLPVIPPWIYAQELGLHVSRAVAPTAAYHQPADGEGANTRLMLNCQEVCFSGGVHRTGRGGLCLGSGRDSSLRSAHDPWIPPEDTGNERQNARLFC